MDDQPTTEHLWLMKLVGSWTFDGSCNMGPDQPPIHNKGNEVVRTLGELWTLGEGTTEMPAGPPMKSIMTLGYSPKTQRYIGTFVASMMLHMWHYNGSLDSTTNTLTLDAEGPSMLGDGSLGKYQDVIQFQDDNNRTLTSRILMPDGSWYQFMEARYSRTV